MNRAPAVFFILGSFVCCARAAVTTTAAARGPARAGRSSALRGPGDPRRGGRSGEAALLAALDAAADVDATLAFDDPMALHHEAPDELRALMGEAAIGPLPRRWRAVALLAGQPRHRAPLHRVEGLPRGAARRGHPDARAARRAAAPTAWCRSGSAAAACRRPGTASTSSSSRTSRASCRSCASTPAQARRLCELQGKRLCTQDEWNLACRGDPDGGADRVYAYGDELDLDRLQHEQVARATAPTCDVSTQRDAWTTCGTEHRAVGRVPAVPLALRRLRPARQRRRDHDALRARGRQDVHAAQGQRVLLRRRGARSRRRPRRVLDDATPTTATSTRAGTSRSSSEASHVNYHLGFRCCKTVGRRRRRTGLRAPASAPSVRLAADPLVGDDHERRAERARGWARRRRRARGRS